MLRTGAPEACSSVRASFSYSRAVRAQKSLTSRVVLNPPEGLSLGRVVAVDAAYWGPGETYGVAVAVVFKGGEELTACYEAVGAACVPYVPGLLAFREAQLMVPAVRAALARAGGSLLLVDGHGIAHPRRFGIASHLGVVLSVPSIGVAKRLLYGRLEGCQLGRCIVADGHVLGVEIESSGRPIYVSPGNMIDVETAASVVRSLMRRGLHLPYPLHVADRISKEERRRLSSLSPSALEVRGCYQRALELVEEEAGQKG